MRRSLLKLNERHLPKALRQALVLLTMLFLPSAAWGEDPTINTVFTGYSSDDGILYGESSTGKWSISTISDPNNVSVEASSNPTGVLLSTSSSNNSLNFDFKSEFKLYGTVNNGTKIAKVEFQKGGTEIINFYVKKGGPGGTTIAQQTVNTNTEEIELVLNVASASFSGDNIDIQIESADNGASIVVKSIKIYNLQTPISVAGNFPDTNGDITGSGIDGTVKFDAQNSTLTLNDAAITGNITYSGTNDLTISFSGINSVTNSESNAIQYKNSESDRPKLTFSSTNGTLTINGEYVIEDFSDVDFGDLKLTSSSAPGIFWEDNRMADYSGNSARDMTITTATVYPIWVMHKQGTAAHTQLTVETPQVDMVRTIDNEDVVICTVSYNATKGELTIEANEDAGDYAFQPGGSNAAIVVGPNMEELTVNLLGNTKITDEASSVFSIWDTTSLIFTTDETSPGSLTGTEIVNWKSKNSGGTGQITYENGLVFNYDSSSTYTETISTKGARIKIGGAGSETVISGSTDENGLFNGTVFFDASKNTLTLNGATLGNIDSYGIKVFVDDLKVVISGENTILGDITYSGNSGQSSSIQINKAEGATSASLTMTNIKQFGACTWGDGLYLTARHSGQEPTNAIAPHYEYSESEGEIVGHFSDYNESPVDEVIFSTTVSYPLWVGGVQVTDDNKDGITGITYTVGQGSYTSISGTVSFNPTGNILKLTNVTLSSPLSDCGAPIISNLPNLEIDVNGRCNLSGYQAGFISDGTGGIKSVNADATLVISTNYTTSSGTDSPTMQIDTYDPIASGFKSISTDNQMIYKRTSNYYLVQRIAQPTISLVNGSLLLSDKNEIDLSYTQNSAVTLKYKITDAAGTAGEEKIFDSNTNEPIENPCTIDAWAVYQSQESELVTGKYFGIADKTIVFNNDTKGTELKTDDLEIIPATKDEGVSFKFSGVNNSGVIMPSQEGTEYKLSIAGIGICEVDMEISVANPTIQVLNPFEDSVSEVKYAKGVVTVLPDKPTIEKEDKDYLDTDKITITRTSVEGEVANDINIFYTWSDDVEVEAYQLYVDGGSVSIYNPDEPIAAQTGTLRAWVGYNAGDNYYYNSKVASEIFEVKKDIASCTVTLPENAIYRGSAYEPVVKESTTATTPLSLGTDYTLSFQKVEGETTSDVESMIDAGTYKITITGAGDFGGTTEVANFQIGQASLADASITTLIVGDKEYEYDADKGFEIPYTGEAIQPNVVVTYTYNDETITVDASEYVVSYGDNNTEVSGDNLASVTVTSTDKNFTAETYKTQNFKIVPAPVTITAENQTVTYNADKQEYDISKVEVSNNNAKLAITYYAKEEDRSKGENALTEAPTNADTYYVRVTLNEESQQHYVADPAYATFTVDQLELTNDNTTITLDNTELTYNGEAQTVSVTEVKVGELVVPTDCYEVSANTATEAGTYTAVVTAKTTNADGSTFKNNFKGSATVDWKINHRTASAAELGFTSETQTASTYYNPDEAFNLPEGYVGYIVTGTNGTNVLTTRVSYIPKGVAVLVEKGSSSANAIDEAPDPANLPLKGTSEPLEVNSIAGGTVYVLYNGEFVKSTSGTIPGKRCYLLIESSVAAGTRAFGINHNKGANGIESALFDDNDVKADDKWFDLQGRRIEKPTKAGIYVVNGKKVMINNK